MFFFEMFFFEMFFFEMFFFDMFLIEIFFFKRKTNEDTIMMTKAMRERKEIERAAVFQKVFFLFED